MLPLLERLWLYRRKQKGWIKAFSQTNSLFSHVPKTAGTSISYGLYGEDPWHYKLEDYSYISRTTFRKLFKFAFVRNPYDRLVSTYRYSFKHVQSHPNTSVRFITQYPTFEDFIFNWVKKVDVSSHYFLAPQYSFIKSPYDDIEIDFIGKFESLDKGYQKVTEKIGKDNSLPFTNKSESKSNICYTEESAKIVYEAYQKDFLQFGYDKNSYKR